MGNRASQVICFTERISARSSFLPHVDKIISVNKIVSESPGNLTRTGGKPEVEAGRKIKGGKTTTSGHPKKSQMA
jgi:hypothetical protein